MIFNENSANANMGVWPYVDHQKQKVGYAYITRNGNLCIKGNKLMDKTKLGHMLINGLYLECDRKPESDEQSQNMIKIGNIYHQGVQ